MKRTIRNGELGRGTEKELDAGGACWVSTCFSPRCGHEVSACAAVGLSERFTPSSQYSEYTTSPFSLPTSALRAGEAGRYGRSVRGFGLTKHRKAQAQKYDKGNGEWRTSDPRSPPSIIGPPARC
eukprot:6256795-Amphidinium_carterae.2